MAGANNVLSALQTLTGMVGSAGNAMGIQGDNPQGLNAAQRMALPADQQGQLQVQTALSQLAQNPDFQNMQPADQQAAILKVTGSPQVAEKVASLSQAAKLNTDNPREMIGQAIKTQQMTPTEGVTGLINPMLGFGNQISISPATSASNNQSNAGVQPAQIPPPNDGFPDGTNRALLEQYKQKNPIAGSIAEQYLNAARVPPQGKEAGDPQDIMGQQIAREVTGGNWNAQLARERNDMANNIASPSGKIYQFSQAANKAPFHAARLIVAHNEQGNSDFPIANAVGNAMDYAGGGAGMTDFNTAKTTFVPEMAKFTAGENGSTQGDREELDKNFTPNMSDKQLTGAASTKVGMGLDAVDQSENYASKIMGRKVQIMSPEARSVAKDIQTYNWFVGAGLKSSPQAQAVYSRIKKAADVSSSMPSGEPVPPVASPAAAAPTSPVAPVVASQPSPVAAPVQPPMKFEEGKQVRNKKTGQLGIVKNGKIVAVGQ